MTGKTKGTKVFTLSGREFEIADEYEDFRERFIAARDKGGSIVVAKMLDDEITFNVNTVIAFIPMIDLGF